MTSVLYYKIADFGCGGTRRGYIFDHEHPLATDCFCKAHPLEGK